MAKRRLRKKILQSVSNKYKDDQEGITLEKKDGTYQDHEVERQSAAIRALGDVEIDQLQTMLWLLRSYFSEEQLQVPVLQFFRENLPILTIAGTGKDGHHDVQWKEADRNLTLSQADERTTHTSLLHRLSVAYPHLSAGLPSLGGFQFSNKSVPFGADKLPIRSLVRPPQIPYCVPHLLVLVFEGPSDSQVYELKNGLQTPDVSNNRLSFRTSTKMLRLSKDGEMLLSVHGSPLGIYKEDNVETVDILTVSNCETI